MRAFGWAVEDDGVFGWFYAEYSFVGGYECQFGHAVGTGVVGLAWDDAGVSYHCRFIECFFASFVGAFKFFFMVVPEKLHANRLPCSFVYHRV